MSIPLKRMLAEGFYYDVGTEKNQFESSVATATEQAKKKFEDSMKQKVLGQKVKIRASRGQPGQPEKDYVIEKVSSASIDWYWKQYVVVFKDDKGKEYFLKPGFKVEVLSAAGQPGQKQTQQTPQEPAKPATKAAPQTPKPAAEPTGQAPGAPMPAGQKNASVPPVKENDDELDRYWDDKEREEMGKKPGFGLDPRAGVEWERDMDPEDKLDSLSGVDLKDLDEAGREYKKEHAAQIVGDVLYQFLSPEKQELANTKGPSGVILPYIKSAQWAGQGGGDPGDGDTATFVLEIPITDMAPDLDTREMELEIADGLRQPASVPGQQYTRGYGDVERLGRLYRITISFTVGLDI